VLSNCKRLVTGNGKYEDRRECTDQCGLE
jgi:hypothetical protein